MRKVIINGANGYVASHFVNELHSQNHEVVALVRDSSKLSSAERMDISLAAINNGNKNRTNLTVESYSLLDKNFSISEHKLKNIFNRPVDYFHFAACLKYNTRDKNEIFKTNVDGVENSIKTFLNFAKTGSRFFFISSVYSCGNFSELFEEKFYANEKIGGFRNYYEQSKRYAENVVKEYIEKHDLKAHVLRLSQVVGNNQSGVTLTNYGIFDFAKKIHILSNKYPHETVRIRVDPDSTQNLIPIDNTINYLMKISKLEEIPVIVNFIGKKSIKNDHIIKNISNLLPINLVQDKTINRESMNALERMVSAGMSFTGLYANTNLNFDSKNLDMYFSPNGNEVTEKSVQKMLEYFIKTGGQF